MDLWRRLSLGALVAPLARPLAGAGPAEAEDGEEPGPVTAAMSRRRAAGRHRGALGTVPPQPVVLGGVRVTQTDGTTCGSTVLLMLAATGDPVLARWLETGELAEDLPAHRIPPEIPRAPGPGLDVARLASTADRLTAAQQHIQRRTSARALRLLPWPPALGTPPWTAAREARFPGVRYQHLPLDDAAAATAPLLAAAHEATLGGTPVPLYAGGDLGRGVTTAVPRHVVLAVPPPARAKNRGYDGAGNPVLHLYEPAGGDVHQVPVADLLGRTAPHAALGHWTHVCWLLLPRTSRPDLRRWPLASARGGGHADRAGPESSAKEEP
ncbi:hypothetical protein GCM10023169_13160 [Georgenia halophila]|uniref:Uncharacterized protein n=1 Tax=Georgenia halophila TaxID=620889 RepID=A0ABP8L2G3_9MICO